VRAATIAFADWIAVKWKLELSNEHDRRFRDRVADAFNRILLEARDHDPPRFDELTRAGWGAWHALREERYWRGRVAVDDEVDALLGPLSTLWREFLRGRRA